jgi:hypothetical protein
MSLDRPRSLARLALVAAAAAVVVAPLAAGLVRVPRDRPGVPDPKPIMDWKRLWRMAHPGRA